MVTDTVIKKGYKQTEIGNIPEDWEVKSLGELFEITSSKRVFQSEWRSSGVPFYRARELAVLGETGTVDNELFIDEEMYEKYRKMHGVPKVGDMLVTGVGTLGKVFVVSDDDKFYFKDGNIIWFKIGGTVDSNYLKQLYLTSLITRQIVELSAGSTVGTYTITGAKKTIIPIPLKSEQAKIAKTLNDFDALIASLEKLIAKKRAIKKGVMQELLTGKRRLPGFSRKWEMKALGEIGSSYGGLSGKRKADFENGEYPYIPFLNIMNNPVINPKFFDYVNIFPGENQNRAQKGDLFFNGSSETPEEVGMCSVLLDDIPNLYLNSFCFGFRFNRKIKANGLYLSYFFRSNVGRQLIFFLAQGATRHNLSKNSFLKLEIPYPSPEEQSAITAVIADLDSEIKELMQGLVNYKMLKQGMMQVLLTGKVRLV